MKQPLTFDRLTSSDDADWAAQLMGTSEPWITLGRSVEASRASIADPSRETYIARMSGERVGFVVLCLTGAFVGYLQSICVTPSWRGRGVGKALIDFSEKRIFAVSPNVFLCVSSFNHAARRLYERAGYTLIGELDDYFVPGHSELLFRKTRGPWREFVASMEVSRKPSSRQDGQQGRKGLEKQEEDPEQDVQDGQDVQDEN